MHPTWQSVTQSNMILGEHAISFTLPRSAGQFAPTHRLRIRYVATLLNTPDLCHPTTTYDDWNDWRTVGLPCHFLVGSFVSNPNQTEICFMTVIMTLVMTVMAPVKISQGRSRDHPRSKPGMRWSRPPLLEGGGAPLAPSKWCKHHDIGLLTRPTETKQYEAAEMERT